MNGMEYYEQLISEKAKNSYYDGCDYTVFVERIYYYSSGVAKALCDMSMITTHQYIYDTTRIKLIFNGYNG